MADKAKAQAIGLNRRAALIGLAAAAASGTAFALTPRREEHRMLDQSLGSLIPASIPPWRFGSSEGVVVARPDEDLPTEEYDQLVGRTYASSGELPPVMLLVAYGSTQGSTLRLHRPETCYPAQGFAVKDLSPVTVDFAGDRAVAAQRMTAIRDQRVERMLYWTRIRNSFPNGTIGEYAAILDSVLRGVVPDGVLVRISTITDDIALADRAIDGFLASLYAASGRPARQILFGNLIAAENSETVSIRKG